MDDRVREHADLLVDWSARIEPGDDVVHVRALVRHRELAIGIDWHGRRS